MRGLRQDKVENGEVGYNQLPPHWIMGRDPAPRPSRSCFPPPPLPSPCHGLERTSTAISAVKVPPVT